mgnify:CR=1 FL=1
MNTKREKPKSLEEENEILVQASSILERMGNRPGITPIDFFRELDRMDINDMLTRTELLKAAASIEMMMIFDDDVVDPTIH